MARSCLSQHVLDGNFDAVNAALLAGANVDGFAGHPLPPITAAAIANRAGIVKVLLAHGADPDRPVAFEPPTQISDKPYALPGERALHIAARTGSVTIVRLLLNRSHANPNAADNQGRTPLMVTCSCPDASVEVVRLLLKAGADPAFAQKNGIIPLHSVAALGRMDLIDMLCSAAPATLNHCAANAETPLSMACMGGHERMVSMLLSLGAVQQPLLDDSSMCPLAAAVCKGFVGVARILIIEGGIRVIGGGTAVAHALGVAVHVRQPIILRLLLGADGEDKRSAWANNVTFKGEHLLHVGASYCCPAVVNVLLEAVANEAARNPEGRIPRDVIGVELGRDGEPQMNGMKEIAVRLMLERGPAYRARSWAWPSDEEANAGDGGGTTAAAAAGVLSSPPAMKTPPAICLRTFRPKANSSSKLFVRLIYR